MNAATGNVVTFRRLPAPADPAAPVVSVIIPTVADYEALARLLNRLRGCTSPPDEIVVVDGGSSARCRSLARRYRCVYVNTRAGRGHQLHAGALRASGDVLWFLHPDASPPANGISLIRDQHRAGSAGGYFRLRFRGRRAWYKSLVAWTINTGNGFATPDGSQSLFASRQAYDATGGFADTPLFPEAPLMRALREHGAFVGLDAAVGISPRPWEQDGWLWRTLRNQSLALACRVGIPARRLVREYRPLGNVNLHPES